MKPLEFFPKDPIAWFSGGVTSAVATKLSGVSDIRMMDINTHHIDTYRFVGECSEWFGHSVKLFYAHSRYKNQFEVIDGERFVNGPGGAACTKLLKRFGREPGGTQIFGFSYDERDRAERICQTEPETNFVFPLIEQKITKTDCFEILKQNHIEIPVMYKMGYHNNNCIGCVKGGMGYWNKIRIDFPAVFHRMAKLERKIDRSCINGVFLDELEPDRGRFKPINCGVTCLFEIESPDFT